MRYTPISGENWKDIDNYEGYYQVNDNGDFRSLDRYVSERNTGRIKKIKGRPVKQWKNHRGYSLVTLSKDGVNKGISSHILVAKAFIPNPNNFPEVNHIDGNKDNNAASNLEWNTRLQNQRHSVYVLGKHFCGEKHSLSKLTEIDVINIINLHKTGNYTYVEIARQFNMEETQISRIVKRRSWKHLKIA